MYDPDLERRIKSDTWQALSPSDRGPTAGEVMRATERDYWELRSLRSIITRTIGPFDAFLSALVPPDEIHFRDGYRTVGKITNIGDSE